MPRSRQRVALALMDRIQSSEAGQLLHGPLRAPGHVLMRRTRLASLCVGALLAVALLVASPALSASSAGDGSLREAAPKYSLSAEGIPDSLFRDEAAWLFARLWERGELEALAGRLRDRMLRQGRYDAALRLTIVDGSGTAPGAAALTLRPLLQATGDVDGPAPRIVGPPRIVGSPRIVAVIAGGAPGAGLADPARSFARGCRGDAGPAGIAAGIAAIRDDAVAAGRYAAAVSVDSVARVGDEVLVHLSFDPGSPVVVEELEIPGATVTKPGAAAAISGRKHGRRIAPAVLVDARERLIGSDLFATVGEPRVVPGREPGRARVLIPVEESNVSHFEGALGVTRDGGLTGLIDLGLGNIAGSGRTAGARWAGLGDGRATYALRYREPALL